MYSGLGLWSVNTMLASHDATLLSTTEAPGVGGIHLESGYSGGGSRGTGNSRSS